MKWEYQPIDIRTRQEEKRKALENRLGKQEADLTSDYQLFCEVLSEIGAEGWELFTLNNDTIGKRPA